VTENLISLDEDLVFFQIINLKGEIVFNSKELSDPLFSKRDLGSFDDSDILFLLKKPNQISREVSIDGKRYLEIFQPYVEDWGRYEYFVKYVFSFDSVKKKAFDNIVQNVSLGLIFFIISVFSLSLFSRIVITKRINKLGNLMESYAKGDSTVVSKLSSLFSISSLDDIGLLAESFGSMIEEVDASRIIVEKRSKDLEVLVSERTKELNHKLLALEKLNKFMIGREVKMIELKKRIASFENVKKSRDSFDEFNKKNESRINSKFKSDSKIKSKKEVLP
jgi:methyl-accepting chemotaxis protein